MGYVHVSAKVDRRVEDLRNSGKTGKALARKATVIIERHIAGSVRHHRDEVGSYTKYGEKRIKNCRKYDLGCGYRLIALQRGVKIFITFLGTHDECQRWLENNSRLKDFNAGAGRTIRVFEQKPAEMISKTNEQADILEDDHDLFRQLTDKDLRRVFSGLVQGLQRVHP